MSKLPRRGEYWLWWRSCLLRLDDLILTVIIGGIALGCIAILVISGLEHFGLIPPIIHDLPADPGDRPDWRN